MCTSFVVLKGYIFASSAMQLSLAGVIGWGRLDRWLIIRIVPYGMLGRDHHRLKRWSVANLIHLVQAGWRVAGGGWATCLPVNCGSVDGYGKTGLKGIGRCHFWMKTKTPFLFEMAISGRPSLLKSVTSNCVPAPESSSMRCREIGHLPLLSFFPISNQ